MSHFPTTRLRRLRHNPAMRDMVRETHLDVNHLIYPIFVVAGKNIKKEIATMPGSFQFSLDRLEEEITAIQNVNLNQVILFGLPASKDETGSSALQKEEVIPQAIMAIKRHSPDMLVATDLCFCEYTSHGHCGILDDHTGRMDVNNDLTLPMLAKQAALHAEVGADLIAPSGMMDGMVQAIRQGLDEANFQHIPIMSYSAKYASALYGPFREAVESSPQEGDRKSYQMDCANTNQALIETELDIQEGADIVMVKPAIFYLDIISKIKAQYPHAPLAAYNVGGEYAMIKAAAKQGWIDEEAAVHEQLISIKRAGADIIITYFAKQYAQWLKKEGRL